MFILKNREKTMYFPAAPNENSPTFICLEIYLGARTYLPTKEDFRKKTLRKLTNNLQVRESGAES